MSSGPITAGMAAFPADADGLPLFQRYGAQGDDLLAGLDALRDLIVIGVGSAESDAPLFHFAVSTDHKDGRAVRTLLHGLTRHDDRVGNALGAQRDAREHPRLDQALRV